MAISHRIENYVQTITTFEYKVFDQTHTDYMYDATPEQCCNRVWKGLYSSATFIKMTVFNLPQGTVDHIDPKVLRDIINVHAKGFEEDINDRNARLREAAEFKKKNNL